MHALDHTRRNAMLTGILATALLMSAPLAAQAEPSFSADEIEAHFAPAAACAATGDCPELGQPRAVCIGTEASCAAEPAAAADPGAFDLLITFELGSDRLSAQAKENLAEFARALQSPALADARFNIDGHTDARGPDGFNLDLSNRRAEATIRYLESLGVPRERLLPNGYGESRPRADDPLADVNRRVEATLHLR